MASHVLDAIITQPADNGGNTDGKQAGYPRPRNQALRMDARPARCARSHVRRTNGDDDEASGARWIFARTARRSTIRANWAVAPATPSPARCSSSGRSRSSRRTSCRRACSSTTTSGSSKAPSTPTAARRSATASRSSPSRACRRRRIGRTTSRSSPQSRRRKRSPMR